MSIFNFFKALNTTSNLILSDNMFYRIKIYETTVACVFAKSAKELKSVPGQLKLEYKGSSGKAVDLFNTEYN